MKELEDENNAKQKKIEEAHEILSRQKTIMAVRIPWSYFEDDSVCHFVCSLNNIKMRLENLGYT